MFIDETYLEGLSEVEKQKVHQIYDALCTPEDRLWNEICRGLVMKTDQEKYPDKIFWFKQDRCYFEYEIKTGYLWCEHDLVWRVFERELSWGYFQIESFIKNKVKEHLENKDVTPCFAYRCNGVWVKEHLENKDVTPFHLHQSVTLEVKEHFKNKDVIPSMPGLGLLPLVKEHFKNKDVTPGKFFQGLDK
jgi:hypothetical protein